MTAADIIHISKDEAIAAVRAASWTQYHPELSACGHPGCEDHPGGVERIHSLSSRGFGTDWDVDDVIAFIGTGQGCGWMAGGFLGHDLVVLGVDGYRMRFAVKRPAEVAA